MLPLGQIWLTLGSNTETGYGGFNVFIACLKCKATKYIDRNLCKSQCTVLKSSQKHLKQ